MSLALAAQDAMAIFCRELEDCPRQREVPLLFVVVDSLLVEAKTVGTLQDGAGVIQVSSELDAVVSQTVNAIMLEAARSNDPTFQPGALGYPQWLQALRLSVANPVGATPIGGPSAVQTLSPLYIELQRYTRLKLLEFVVSHEFAHITERRCGSQSLDPVVVEPACDELALRMMFQRDEPAEFATAALHIVYWFIASHHHDLLLNARYKNLPPTEEGLSLSEDSISIIASGDIQKVFPGRNWLTRADKVIQLVRELLKNDSYLSDEVSYLLPLMTATLEDTRSWTASLDN